MLGSPASQVFLACCSLSLFCPSGIISQDQHESSLKIFMMFHVTISISVQVNHDQVTASQHKGRQERFQMQISRHSEAHLYLIPCSRGSGGLCPQKLTPFLQLYTSKSQEISILCDSPLTVDLNLQYNEVKKGRVMTQYHFSYCVSLTSWAVGLGFNNVCHAPLVKSPPRPFSLHCIASYIYTSIRKNL